MNELLEAIQHYDDDEEFNDRYYHVQRSVGEASARLFNLVNKDASAIFTAEAAKFWVNHTQEYATLSAEREQRYHKVLYIGFQMLRDLGKEAFVTSLKEHGVSSDTIQFLMPYDDSDNIDELIEYHRERK